MAMKCSVLVQILLLLLQRGNGDSWLVGWSTKHDEQDNCDNEMFDGEERDSDDDYDDDDQPKATLGGLGSDMKWKATQNNSCAKVNQQLLPATIILIGFFHWIFKPIYHYIFIGCLLDFHRIFNPIYCWIFKMILRHFLFLRPKNLLSVFLETKLSFRFTPRSFVFLLFGRLFE